MDPNTIINGFIPYYRNEPFVVIIEQPAPDSHIFRYASEILVKEANGSEVKKRNAGCIIGVNSKPGNKTYPTIKVFNHPRPILVIVSCVDPVGPRYRPHPHKLIGSKHCKDGVYRKVVHNNDMTHSLKNVAIERVKKNDVRDSLQLRKTLNIDPYLTGFEDSNIDLKTVRLCFQVFIPGPDDLFSIPLEPVVSDPIYHRKDLSYLNIVQLSHFEAPVTGGTKMIILCDHVDKNDIEVWFYEKQGERIVWEAKAEFGINDVYKSVAISFKTPPYRNKNIHKSVYVFLELRKPSENKRGEPREFCFSPDLRDSEGLPSKILKPAQMFDTWSRLGGYAEPERQFAIGVPRISSQSSHEMVRDDPPAGNQFPFVSKFNRNYPLVSTPSDSIVASSTIESCSTGTMISPGTQLLSGQLDVFASSSIAHQLASVISHDATTRMQKILETEFNVNYPVDSTPSVSIVDWSTANPPAESCGPGTTISLPTHLQPAQSVGIAPSCSGHGQASVVSHDPTFKMQQIPEPVNTEKNDDVENALSDQFNSMDLLPDPVENRWIFSLSLFADAQSFQDQSSSMDTSSSSSKEQQ